MQLTLIYRESGPSLTIGTGPGTGRKKLNGTHFSVRIFRLGILEYLSRRFVYSGNFPVGQTKLALPFTIQPKSPDFLVSGKHYVCWGEISFKTGVQLNAAFTPLRSVVCLGEVSAY